MAFVHVKDEQSNIKSEKDEKKEEKRRKKWH